MRKTLYSVIAAGTLLFATTSCSEEKEGGYYSTAMTSSEEVKRSNIRGYELPGTAGRNNPGKQKADVPADQLVREYYTEKVDLSTINPLHNNVSTIRAGQTATYSSSGNGSSGSTDTTSNNAATGTGSGNGATNTTGTNAAQSGNNQSGTNQNQQ
ncbi:hypothetical protein [Pontibacter harenae]|uniref:hypothetical protein n=1 Tax=Pontibacter harenae TaxID=2894083 RepID=UPI001E322C45|nr:hypothetical protein [Pontibacter harenae]MCC9167805.1 hypothetical protein [Pontibacter harenae]